MLLDNLTNNVDIFSHTEYNNYNYIMGFVFRVVWYSL